MKLPAPGVGGNIGGLVSEGGEISLVRMQPLTIIHMAPYFPSREAGRHVRWSCAGGPAEVVEAFCLEAQW